jgi:hypothetical protein
MLYTYCNCCSFFYSSLVGGSQSPNQGYIETITKESDASEWEEDF